MERESLDTTRLIWTGLIALAMFGVAAAIVAPPSFEEEVPTPAPSPAVASLQCLDGRTYRSVDELSGQPDAQGFPTRGYWTLKFADGGYVIDQAGVHEAGRYRCDGTKLSASGTLGAHRGQIEAGGPHLEWDGQGYVAQDAPTPRVTTTSG